VAVVPVHVFTGNRSNAGVVLDAVRAGLSREGFQVLGQDRVESALRARGLSTDRHLSAGQLAGLRDALGVDYVVYARVLGVGEVLSADPKTAAVALVNVLGKASDSAFVHTRQVSRDFTPSGRNPQGHVIPASDAAELSRMLLSGFFDKSR
jgi:hypothetical protein